MVKIDIDFDKCTGCGTCVETCPVNVYKIDKEKGKTEIVAISECLDCKACEVQCPEECIEVISED
ncbi:MAG: ferredoxin family protein [Promethearchaeota archaeon]